MPILENSIKQAGSPYREYYFIFLEGRIHYPSQKLTTYFRSGVDDIGVVDTGKRAAPFRMRGLNFVEDWGDAEVMLGLYQALLTGAPLILTRNGETINGEFHLLDVSEYREPTWVEGVCGDLPQPFDQREKVNVRHETIWTFVGQTPPDLSGT